MTQHTTENIRNIALVGHVGSGKTTLAEAMLYRAGASHSMGSVDKGTAILDYDPLEKKYHHSVSSSVAGLDHAGKHINIIDTPGFPDFLGPTISALPAVETIVVVINAQAGVEPLARKMMEVGAEYRTCRMILVNKIDAENVDLPAVLEQLREAFGTECLPINLPAGGGKSVVDCFFNPAGESDFSSVAEVHTQLVDQVVEVDDKLMELYLEQGEISPEQLHDPFEKALRTGHIIPVCFASAETGAGITEFLDVLAKLAPNPLEGNPHPFIREHGGETETVEADQDPKHHVLAHVFKVDFDPFAGKLGVFRIHQGTITKDTQLFVDDGRKAFKVGHLFRLQGKDTVEAEVGVPGDICAVAKVDDIHWDAILHDSHDEDDLHVKPPWFPAPMAGLAVHAKRRGDEQKISDVLSKLSEEDPCLSVERDASSNETVLRGLGDLHLRMAVEKMDEHFHVQVETTIPTVPYRETISGSAEGHYRHKKQTGGAGQFGEVFLRVEALARGAGFEFHDESKGGVIPGGFIPAIEKGIRQAMADGALAGFPIQDVKVTVYDGKHHNVDSNEVSFVIAGRKAFEEALLKARPMVLEPIVDLTVTMPEGSMGDISGELSARRARITNSESLGTGTLNLSALVPLAELEDFQSRVKSLTGGEGSYAMQLSHYDPVPPNIQQQLKSQFQGQHGE